MSEVDAAKQILDGKGRSTATGSTGVSVDATEIDKLRTAIKGLGTELDSTKKKLDALMGSVSAPTQSAFGRFLADLRGGGGGGGTAKGYGPPPQNTSPPTAAALAKMGTAAWGVQTASNAVGGFVRGIDNRVDANRAYALPADRLSVLQQQMYGMSQQQVAGQIRKPMMNYIASNNGGANALLYNQARYGINAKQQAGGMSALQVASGYSVSTQDLIGMQNQLTSPQVANRMFALMGGFNFNKAGGGAKDMFTTIQQLSKRVGLGDERILKGAMQQGSFTRGNLTNLGIDGQTQDLMLQYAQENIQYKKKGGKGDYNPNDKKQRKLMGVEDNYSTQAELTQLAKTKRDESMYRDQASSYAALERSNRALISTMEKLEHTFSGVISARTKSRGIQRVIGGALKGVGTVAALAGAPEFGAPAFMLGAALSGDGTTSDQSGGGGVSPAGSASAANDDNINVPTDGGMRPLSYVKKMPSFAGMKQTMQDRLLRAMREHPALGFGGGLRSTEAQKAMFTQRYTRTDQKTDIKWDGSYWKHTSGAPAAPPGSSMHEIGLAADMAGDVNWLVANASRFGLKSFANMKAGSEPWHFQPAEFPDSRGEYEKTNGAVVPVTETSASSGSLVGTSSTSSGTSTGAIGPRSSVMNMGGMSMQDILDTVMSRRPRGNTAGVKVSSGGGTGTGGTTGPTGPPVVVPKGGKMTLEQITQVAYNAGFRGEDLAKAVAITMRESDGVVTAHTVSKAGAKNPEDSYGLWQINALAHGDVLASLGMTGPDLYDPNKAAIAMRALQQKSGWGPWTTYKKGIGFGDTGKSGLAEELAAATPIANAFKGGGDPMPAQRSNGGNVTAGSSTMHITSNPRIEMPLSFTFNGVPGDVDIRKIAQQVRSAIRSEVDLELMRTS